MSMWKKIALTLSIAGMIVASIAVIGWITFQEKIRLAVQEYKADQQSIQTLDKDPSASDHAVIETKEEAMTVVKQLEGLLRTLEENNIPTE